MRKQPEDLKLEVIVSHITDALKTILYKRKLKTNYVCGFLNISQRTLNKMLKGSYDYNIEQIAKIEYLFGKKLIKINWTIKD